MRMRLGSSQVRAAIAGARQGMRIARAAAPYVRRAAQSVRSSLSSRSAPSGYARSSYEPPRQHNRGKMHVIKDEGGYNQFETHKYKTGRKKPKAAKRANLIDAITVRQRIRFSGINELSAGQGFFPLSHEWETPQFDHLPIYVMNLTSTRQQSVGQAAAPLWRLYQDKAANRLGFTIWNGQLRDGAINTGWQLEDDEAAGTSVSVGRKSLIDWVRIRLNVWGKKTAPSRMQVQLVQFNDDIICPERDTVLADPAVIRAPMSNPEAQQYWQSVVKPLINNPCSSVTRTARARAKILKTWKIDIDPTSTTENDTDPHCKFLDIFHKVGKLIDYSSASTFQSTSTLNDARTYGTVTPGFSPYPNRIESSLYLVIRSMQQDYIDQGGSASNTQTATFDMNVQTCHVTVQAP